MRVEIAEKQLLLDGAPFYIRGGEIHYFRLKAGDWRDRLEKLKNARMNTVSAYMPWFWHEPEEGLVDLDGTTCPERNLRKFLELCANLRLKVVARPGPFVNSELRYGGYPKWVFTTYPETMSRRADGLPVTGRPAPAEGEPKLRELVKKWYSAVVPLIREFSAEQGGPVIIFQPDNEISAAWTYGLTNSLYDPSIIGENGLWPLWLEKKYGKPNFRRTPPPTGLPSDTETYRLAIDWLNFKKDFFADWGITLARWVREFGLDLPLAFNEPVAGFYTHGDHSGFGARLVREAINGFTCAHTYFDRIYDLEGAGALELAVELLKISPVKAPAVSFESNHTWFTRRLSRNHINGAYGPRMGLAHGLNGSTVYMFAGGFNPEGSTLCGEEYWEDAPVAPDGGLNPDYEIRRDFNEFAAGWEQEILSTDKVQNLHVGISPALRYVNFLGAPDRDTVQRKAETGGSFEVNPEPGGDRQFGAGHDWLGGAEGVTVQTRAPESSLWKNFQEFLIVLRRLNVAWGLTDMLYPNRRPGNGLLVVPSTGFLEKEAITYILAHLDNGGDAFFYPTIPAMNPDGNADDRISRKIGVTLKNKVRPAGAQPLDYGWRMFEDRDGRRLGDPSWIFLHDWPQKKEALASFEGKPLVCAVKGPAGKIVVSGINPFFGHSSHLRFWKSVLSLFGVRPPADTDGPYLNCVLRRGENNGPALLAVANILGHETPTRISIREEALVFPKNCALRLRPCEARLLWLNMPVRNNTIVYCTHEFVPLDKNKALFSLRGKCGDEAEIALAGPVKITLDGKVLAMKKKKGLFIGNFRFSGSSAQIEIKS